MCNGNHKQEHHKTRNPNLKHDLALFKETIDLNVNTVDDTINTYSGGSVCELCGSDAKLYCQADDAYLCRRCDGWVHGANFLASRHVRCVLCDTCHRFSRRYLVGASREVVVGGKRRRSSHCDDSDDCSPQRMLKRPFLFI